MSSIFSVFIAIRSLIESLDRNEASGEAKLLCSFRDDVYLASASDSVSWRRSVSSFL